MLRLILVLGMVVVGVAYAVRHPFYALLFYLWNAYFRPEYWVWDNSLISVLHISYVAAVLVVGSTLLRRDAVPQGVPFGSGFALVVVFTAQALLSTLASDYREYAWPYLIEFVKVVVIVGFIVALVDDLAKLRALLLVIAFSMGFEGAKQGWAELVRHPGSINDNPIPYLGDNNGVAVGMLMLAPLLVALASTTMSAWERTLHRFVLFGVLYRGITTYSRGGFLSCLALACVYWLRSHHKVRALLALCLASALALPLLPDAFWERMHTILTFEQTGEESAVGRLHFWRVAAAMANDRPLTGVGFNAYNAAYDRYDWLRGAFGYGRSVHSTWFGVLAETGYVGFSLYVAVFLHALWNCQRVRRLRSISDTHAELAAYAIAIEISLVVYFVGGTFLPLQYSEMAWHFVGLSVVVVNIARRLLAAQHEVDALDSIDTAEAVPMT
jgi:probable O-glycosylation ligase (exosortase A-associated)